MDTERQVAAHYGRQGLEQAILDALRASGKDVDRLVASDLSGADELHLGWRAATVELARDLGLEPGMELLDIGSGLGGPARYVAEAHGCRVTGVDVTETFVETANALTQRCGLADKVSFRTASALALPFADGSFDRAMLIHVGMNVQDKMGLFAEVRRVLRPGGLFGLYDIMRRAEDEIPYPMPWADGAGTSFVETADTYRQLLTSARFTVEREVDRSDLAKRLGQEMREKAAREGAPPLGLHTLMGEAAAPRIANVMGALGRSVIAPIEMVARAT
jgi:ubiquinone/menaquinone biosynthesis C-methylase UbiE